MSERQVTAEIVRRSRARMDAASLAARAQERARTAAIERAEQRVSRAVRMLGLVMAALWLVAVVILIAMEVWF